MKNYPRRSGGKTTTSKKIKGGNLIIETNLKVVFRREITKMGKLNKIGSKQLTRIICHILLQIFLAHSNI